MKAPVTLNRLQDSAPNADAFVVTWKRDRSRAGQTAEANYERLLKLWCQQMQLPLLLTGAMMLLLATSLWLWAPHGQFYAGLAIGSMFGMANLIWSDPPDYVARWRRGAEGERKTARALRRCERAGWHTFHDRSDGRGNLDHVLVGPAGVFLLESKNLSGRITLEVDGLTAAHEDPGADFTHRKLSGVMLGRSAHLKERIEETTRLRSWVQAVVVVWGDFPAALVEADKLVYLHGDELDPWLASQPTKLSPRDQRLIELALEAGLIVPPATPIGD